ncbi:MAG: hypothetical protein FWG53_03050 [Clostridiales bacterium]|nr:hypothetical protein [Clostridiales bacterium]
MKKKLLLAAGVVVLLIVGAVAWAASDGPGSESDPVVSKSYVDAKTSFEPIQLEEGQKLIGVEGTEIILRSGEAFAIDNGENGVSDLTSGKDLMSGDQVAANHLLLVPRDDGRGIMALTEAWVMVRGGYEIQ